MLTLLLAEDWDTVHPKAGTATPCPNMAAAVEANPYGLVVQKITTRAFTLGGAAPNTSKVLLTPV